MSVSALQVSVRSLFSHQKTVIFFHSNMIDTRSQSFRDSEVSEEWRLVKKENFAIEPSEKRPRKQSRGPNNIRVKGTVSYKREDVMKWNGWGYTDSYFYLSDSVCRFSGNRYPICNRGLPFFRNYIKDKFDVHLHGDMSQENLKMSTNEADYSQSKLSNDQINQLKTIGVKISILGSDRLFRSHGQGLNELFQVRNGTMKRIPDGVIWPECHEDVVEIVKICDQENIVIIPFGGGTSVSGAITCPQDEPRPILSMDTCMMNEILWIDKESLVACCESGIIGQDLERELQHIGYTTGHEPDSIEFSTLGGWVATRASGMKKNLYGNIEDIVIQARMVTPRGVLERGNRVPRLSCGPDFNHVIIGSEGCFGVITEVTVKIRPLPAFKRYGSLIFPDFQCGVSFMREVAKQRCQPASIRMLDNDQFQFGAIFRPEPTIASMVMDGLKHLYISTVKGFDWNKMVVVTILYEGEKVEVLSHEIKINKIAASHGGIPAGETNGKRGYHMTFVIAYIRDVALEMNIYAESLETSVPWDRVLKLVQSVKTRINRECMKLDISRQSVMCRIAQTYDAGCCIYFYFSISGKNLTDPVATTEYLEEVARDVIVEMGGSISHHHGVGKARRKWYKNTVSQTGVELFKACKAHMDPNNIFATVNLTEDLKLNVCKL